MKVKILIVDDNSDCCELLDLALREHGHVVKTACSDREAMDMMDVFLPDILVCDWLLMGVCEGLEVARAFRRAKEDISIIFMSGLPEEMIADRASEVGYSKIIRKQLDMDLLAGEIVAALESRSV